MHTTRGHYIGGNSASETPNNIIYLGISTERDPDRSTARHTILRLGGWCAIHCQTGARHYGTAYYGHSVDDLWACIRSAERDRRPLWVFFHKAARVLSLVRFWEKLEDDDIHYVKKEYRLDEEGAKTSRERKGMLVLESRPNFARLFGERGPMIFCDALNYYDATVDEYADVSGWSPSPAIRSAPLSCPEIERAAREADILRLVVGGLIRHWKMADLGNWKYTIASLSLTNWQHETQGKTRDGDGLPVVVGHCPLSHAVERGAYYGGRVEAFWTGKSRCPVYHLDVNSLYPFIMSTHRLPYCRVSVMEHPGRARVTEAVQQDACGAHVIIESDRETYPIRLDGQVVYCRGRFATHLCGRELRRAVDSGHVRACGWAVFYRTDDLFSAWVNRWYGKKREAKEAGPDGSLAYMFAKSMLNSLYGKWGQKGERWVDDSKNVPWKEWGYWTEIDPTDETIIRCRSIAGIRQRRSGETYPRHYMPAISSAITAGGREYMREVMSLVEAGEVYYMATDSLIVDHTGYLELLHHGMIDDSAIGKLSIRGQYSDWEIVGPNLLRLGDEWTVAGVASTDCIRSVDRIAATYSASIPSIISSRPDETIWEDIVDIQGIHPRGRGARNDDGWMSPYVLGGYDPEGFDPF